MRGVADPSFHFFGRVLADMAGGGEGVDEELEGRGADVGEVAGKGFRAVGLLPRGLADHAPLDKQ